MRISYRSSFLNAVALLLLVGVSGWHFWRHPLQELGVQEVPDLGSLKRSEVPLPPNLDEFVKDRVAAAVLGKALFWDMQMGSDGVQACASCHFNAGADSRIKNQLRPAGPGSSDESFSFGGPNYTLQAGDFPFPKNRNEIVSSQGVFHSRFLGIMEGDLIDQVQPLPDPVFNLNGVATRRVEPRNTPTVINSGFFHRSFWDGRANNVFNGVDPFGPRNDDACIWFAAGSGLDCRPIALENAALASQAVGPVLSELEASAIDRSFADVGRKMLHLRPLSRQLVHTGDGLLGPLSHPSGKGLRMTYRDVIADAFHDHLWGDGRTPEGYTQTEANFSLFWGLSIMLYEASLVSDDAPFDRFMDGDPNALTARQKYGLKLFVEKGKCINCHAGPEFSKAAIHLQAEDQEEGLVERMVMGDGRVALYDNGFYNIGVSPTADDPGVGGVDPWNTPLSFTRQYLQRLRGHNVPDRFQVDPCTFEVPFNPADCRQHPNPDNERTAVDGAMKTPSLRNVELTAPYFHNGGYATLMQVVEFYNRGGAFSHENRDDLDPDISPLGLTQYEKEALVDFMISLTDDRVRFRNTPFDHPELLIPNGHRGDHLAVESKMVAPGVYHAVDEFMAIQATGTNGGSPLATFTEQLGLTHFDGVIGSARADLNLAKTVDNTAPAVGDEVSYTLTLLNFGPDAATEIVVDDALPDGVSFLYASGDGQFANGRWTLKHDGPLRPGERFKTTIRVKVAAAGRIVNTASIAFAREEDPDPSDNTATAALVATERAFWANANPLAGTVTGLAAAPRDGRLFIATDGGGVHRSTDGGDNWYPTGSGSLLTANARGVAISPSDESLWMITAGEGAWRSEDFGDHYKLRFGTTVSSSHSNMALSLAIDAGGDVFIGTDGKGLFVSDDDGDHWKNISYNLPNRVIRFILIQNGGAGWHKDRVFVATHGRGVWYLDDGSQTWVEANGYGSGSLDRAVVHALAIDSGGNLFAGTNDGAYRSDDDGATWTRVLTGVVNTWDQPVPVRSLLVVGDGWNEYVLAGTDGNYLFRASTSSPHVWQQHTGLTNPPNGTVSGLRSSTVLALLAYGGRLYAGTQDEGLHRSDDGGVLWNQITNVMANTQVQALAFNAAGTRLYAGTYGYGVMMADVGLAPVLSWTRVNNGLTNQWVYALESKTRGHKEYLFAGTWGGGVFRSSDGGEEWTFSGLPGRIVYDLAIGPDGTIYAATNNGEVARSVDDGLTWQIVGVAATAVWAIGVEPRSGNLYAGTFGAGIYTSVDGGYTWTQTTINNRYVFDFDFDTGKYPTTIYAGTATGVLFSGNQGATWESLDNGLTVPDVRSIRTTWPGGPLLAGTWGGGVFTYDRDVSAWVRDGLPSMPVLAFSVNPTTGEAFASTEGGGVFRKAFTPPSTVSAESKPSEAELPADFALGQNYPNPFNPSTTIAFSLEEAGTVRLAVYDALGRELRLLADGAMPAGSHQVNFEAGDLPSGVYFYRIDTPHRSLARSMILMK